MSAPDRPAFYTDEHVPSAVAKELRRRDVDVLRCQEAEMMGADDLAHLTLAVEQGRVLITRDQDFLRLHAEWMAEGRAHAGIIFITAKSHEDIGAIVKKALFVSARAPEEVENLIFYV
jgi:predicted nuclease of predicted toxin-antitoxin system